MQLFFASGELLRNENQIILTSQLQTNSTTPHSPWYVFSCQSRQLCIRPPKFHLLHITSSHTHPSPPIVSAVQALSFIFVAKFSESRGPCKNHFLSFYKEAYNPIAAFTYTCTAAAFSVLHLLVQRRHNPELKTDERNRCISFH